MNANHTKACRPTLFIVISTLFETLTAASGTRVASVNMPLHIKHSLLHALYVSQKIHTGSMVKTGKIIPGD